MMFRRYLQRFKLLKLVQATRPRMQLASGVDSCPMHVERVFQPRVRRLEPRFVLNATAELNAIGQLFVMGTSASDTVQLGVDASGDLLLRDQGGTIIPIQNHPDGIGLETNPLDPTAITSGQIRFEMGGSNDLLKLDLPSGLDVTVIDGDGDDVTVLRFADDRSPGTATIDSESIEIDPGSLSVSANGASLFLTGDVSFGQNGQASELALGDGDLHVAGQLNLSGDVLISGSVATVDLSAANLVTAFDQTTLTISLQNQIGSDLSFGGSDDSAGAFLNEIDVRSASTVSFLHAPMFIAGDLSVADVDSIQVDVDIDTTVGPQDGNVSLHSTTGLSVTSGSLISVGDATITLSGSAAGIDLSDGNLSSDNTLTAISIHSAGDVMLGNVTAASGDLVLGILGGEVGDIRQAIGTTLTVDALLIDSIGSADLSNSQNQFRVIEGADIDGDLAVTDSIGNLTIVDINSRGSEVTVVSSGSMLVGRVRALDADVRLTARQINDATVNARADIIAPRLFLHAKTGIGNLQPLELSTTTKLTATSNTGDIVLDKLGPRMLELQSVVAGDGAIKISSDGTMVATKVISENASGLDDGTRDIELTVTRDQSDILVKAITAAGGADVTLIAGDDILDRNLDDNNSIVADDLTLVAGNQIADSDIAINLTTMVNDLQAAITGSNRGDLFVRQIGSITLAASDAQADEIIETSNGQIVIVASGDITIADTSPDDDGDDWKFDPEIIARGAMGRIDLESTNQIELQNDVQLHSEKVTTRYPNPESVTNPAAPVLQRSDRSVFLQSDSVVFGERIEINTGVDQGVARFFASRPIVEIDRSDPDHPKPAQPADPNVIPAFFDPFTVDTNILEQAAVNDATGILTMDLGRQGERGLTVDIDWGAPGTSPDVFQFQQLNGLSADDSIFVGIESTGKPLNPTATPDPSGQLDIQHYYTEDAILDSRENGRTASTDPLEVRFAVRHHDSIFVEANTVTQSPHGEAISVVGRIVSSTDNPLTLGDSANELENGQASFIIPSLSIPVAFFPVRDVIPEFETPEFVVTKVSETPLSGGSFETEETSVSAAIGREEYFQIRMLSPDPNGEDLAPPQRLPDDILSGDKIQRMFKELPDGRYEIEYVVGAGNERSILRVDVRDGEATIPGESLDAEGLLELETIEPQADEQAEQQADKDELDQDNPADDDSAMLGAQTATRSVAGVVLAATMKRRFGRHKQRLSAAGRFAVRRYAQFPIATCPDHSDDDKTLDISAGT